MVDVEFVFAAVVDVEFVVVVDVEFVFVVVVVVGDEFVVVVGDEFVAVFGDEFVVVVDVVVVVVVGDDSFAAVDAAVVENFELDVDCFDAVVDTVAAVVAIAVDFAVNFDVVDDDAWYCFAAGCKWAAGDIRLAAAAGHYLQCSRLPPLIQDMLSVAAVAEAEASSVVVAADIRYCWRSNCKSNSDRIAWAVVAEQT